MQDTLTLYGRSFTNRILLGTARYESPTLLVDAIKAADPAMVTVALRKQIQGDVKAGEAFWQILRAANCELLPNTAGCYTMKEALNTALMAQELFETDFIKLEVIGDEQNLQPDPFGLAEAATELVKRGFRVLPYCTDDLIVCRRLLDAGCEVLMPWAAPIGTGQGPRNPRALRELRDRLPDVPLIVDAGPGFAFACLPGDGVGVRRRAHQHGCFARDRSRAHVKSVCRCSGGRAGGILAGPHASAGAGGAQHPGDWQAVLG